MYHCICSTIQIYSPFMPFIMSPFFITVNPVNNFRSCTVENFSRTLISILYVYYSDKNYFAAVLRFSLLECSIFMQSRRNRATRATLDFTTSLCKGFIAHSSYLSALNFCNSPVWNIDFDELDFFSILNWIFLSAVACIIQVWNRLKIKFIKLDISNWRIAISSVDR